MLGKMKLSSDRINRLPPYLFAEIDRIKMEALSKGKDIIDMGVGDPDLRPPEVVIERLRQSATQDGMHNYASYNGTPGLRTAFARWFKRRFNVELDPDKEVLPLLGSKEGIGHIYLGVTDPGDEVLVPDPGYPVYMSGAILTGAVPVRYPLREENSFLPDMDELNTLCSPRTRMIWVNYPSNPTTSLASLETFEELVEFAVERGILLCQDAAYSEIVFDGKRSPSILQVNGAKETAVEFFSLSKTYCMPGWRVGFAVGNPSILSSLGRVKTNLDSGIFLPVQEASMIALDECDAYVDTNRKIFENRRNRFMAALRDAGLNLDSPSATFYVWMPVPDGYSSMDYTRYLLEEAGIVCTPGIGFGPTGEGFVRISLTVNDGVLEKAMERIRGLRGV